MGTRVRAGWPLALCAGCHVQIPERHRMYETDLSVGNEVAWHLMVKRMIEVERHVSETQCTLLKRCVEL